MVRFEELKIGDLFWDDPGNLCRKMSATEVKFLDGDPCHYLFPLTELVRKYETTGTPNQGG